MAADMVEGEGARWKKWRRKEMMGRSVLEASGAAKMASVLIDTGESWVFIQLAWTRIEG